MTFDDLSKKVNNIMIFISEITKRLDLLENKAERFKVPKVSEIEDYMSLYINSKGLTIRRSINDIANDFFDYYDSINWNTKAGKIKRWESRARTWIRKDQNNTVSKKNFTTFSAIEKLYEKE